MTPEVIWWQPILTDHQSYTLEEFERALGRPVSVYVAATRDATRDQQGWVARHASSIRPELVHARSLVSRILAGRDAIHIFASPFEESRFIFALLAALVMGVRAYVVSEPYSPVRVGYLSDSNAGLDRLKALLRPLVYRLYGFFLRRRVAGVFAISRLAAEQYAAIGVPPNRIFRFGYFVPRVVSPTSTDVAALDSPPGALRLVFVGALIRRKGLDILIQAVRNVRSKGVDLTLDAYGAGSPAQYDFDDQAVHYRGTIPFGQAQGVIAGRDVLVLPSRYDGWGVVVNEAILAGVPVITSSLTGAGNVAEELGCGITFASENVASLEDVLIRLAQDRALLERMRAATHDAAARLDPSAAGRYLAAIVNEVPATSPLDSSGVATRAT